MNIIAILGLAELMCFATVNDDVIQLVDMEDEPFIDHKSLQNIKSKCCDRGRFALFSYRLIVLILLIGQIGVLSYIFFFLKTETNTILPQIRQILDETPAIRNIISSLDNSLPEIKAIIDATYIELPRIRNVIQRTNESLPEIQNILIELNQSLPQIMNITNGISTLNFTLINDGLKEVPNIVAILTNLDNQVDYLIALAKKLEKYLPHTTKVELDNYLIIELNSTICPLLQQSHK